MFYAHSVEGKTETDWQGLADHLYAVATLAGQFAAIFGAERAAILAGVLHDLGKYHPLFQARLKGSKAQVDHSTAGAAIVKQRTAGNDQVIAELIAYAIAGHHAGLPDKMGSAAAITTRLEVLELEKLAREWEQELTLEATDLLPGFVRQMKDYRGFRLAFLGRMLFSCLVDADFKDTEAFYSAVEGRTIDRDWPALPALLPELIAKLDAHFAKFTKVNDINTRRTEILAHVRSKATMDPGLFTLTVPTGGGKTLASLAFALDHALAHGKRRIIYAIPFTSIIDQTAKIFRDVLGDEVILEHHSNLEDIDKPGKAGREKLQLAMEDWAAPIIVTTNVQLFESLFAARPSRCRKLHNIANSVIILDEAQTLPRPLLAPCVRAIDELAKSYGCTIVLCTATQPALDAAYFPEPKPKAEPHPRWLCHLPGASWCRTQLPSPGFSSASRCALWANAAMRS